MNNSFTAPCGRTWDIAFHSGMSAAADIRAALDVGVPLGVEAPSLASNWLLFRRLGEFMGAGGQLFFDTGAFSAFRRGEVVQWPKVFAKIDQLISAMDEFVTGDTNPYRGLTLVAPDVVADQAGTLALWRAHQVRICSWIALGVRVVVPIQQGVLSAPEMIEAAKVIFGTDQFCAGIPSNLAAMPAEQCAKIKHHDFHVLGRVHFSREVQEKFDALIGSNPGARISADATWLRSRTKQLCQTEEVIRQERRRPDYSRVERYDSLRTCTVRALLRSDAYTVSRPG